MIHQLIFAAPKPGMTEEEFQNYWLTVHAVKYASKIKQIKKYLIDTRVARGGDEGDVMFGGVAEIWLRNEQEQLESLQTPEFLEGARLDEPRWAAFWKTLVLDTDAHEIVSGPELPPQPGRVKTLTLLKRREGTTLEEFRARSLGGQADLAKAIPGLRRYLQCHTRDSWYGFGEPRFDAVYMAWFDSVEALEAAAVSPEQKAADADRDAFINGRYLFSMTVAEHWVIGPEPRA